MFFAVRRGGKLKFLSVSPSLEQAKPLYSCFTSFSFVGTTYLCSKVVNYFKGKSFYRI